ncbi:MAG: hypothetical protein ACE5HT_11505 [Gemmatimonadales bacterium]
MLYWFRRNKARAGIAFGIVALQPVYWGRTEAQAVTDLTHRLVASRLWEATPALVHTPAGPVSAVFMPRDSLARPALRNAASGFRLDLGARSR